LLHVLQEDTCFSTPLMPKTENFFLIFWELHFGHETSGFVPETSFSNSFSQFWHLYSKIGILSPYFGTFSQSLRNLSIPMSVSGCFKSCSITEKGIVAICAPILAASTTCRGLRMLATMTSVLNP